VDRSIYFDLCDCRSKRPLLAPIIFRQLSRSPCFAIHRLASRRSITIASGRQSSCTHAPSHPFLFPTARYVHCVATLPTLLAWPISCRSDLFAGFFCSLSLSLPLLYMKQSYAHPLRLVQIGLCSTLHLALFFINWFDGIFECEPHSISLVRLLPFCPSHAALDPWPIGWGPVTLSPLCSTRPLWSLCSCLFMLLPFAIRLLARPITICCWLILSSLSLSL
jgi:hypothetical protein